MNKIHKLNFPTKTNWETFKSTIQKDDNWIDGIITVIEGGQLPKLLSKPITDKYGNKQRYDMYDTWAIDVFTEPDFDNSIFKDYYIKVDSPIMAIADSNYEIIDEYKN